MLKLVIIIFGILLTWWGIYCFKKEDRFIKNNKIANVLDILINGWGSGLGMAISGIVCVIIGIVLFFTK